jgi:surface antigen
MRWSLQELGYVPIIKAYHVPGDLSRQGQGTVLVDSETRTASGKPMIYTRTGIRPSNLVTSP